MQMPPDDSIFALPIWKKQPRDSRTTRIQMNPAAAYQRTSPVKTQQMAIGIGMAVVLLIVLVGGYQSLHSKQSVNVQASFNMKRSVSGIITGVNQGTNTFTVSYESSPDETIVSANKKLWTVQLPPGASFTRPMVTTMNVCFSIHDIREGLTDTLPGSCGNLVGVGRRALIEYLILKPTDASLIAKTIIIESSGK